MNRFIGTHSRPDYFYNPFVDDYVKTRWSQELNRFLTVRQDLNKMRGDERYAATVSTINCLRNAVSHPRHREMLNQLVSGSLNLDNNGVPQEFALNVLVEMPMEKKSEAGNTAEKAASQSKKLLKILKVPEQTQRAANQEHDQKETTEKKPDTLIESPGSGQT